MARDIIRMESRGSGAGYRTVELWAYPDGSGLYLIMGGATLGEDREYQLSRESFAILRDLSVDTLWKAAQSVVEANRGAGYPAPIRRNDEKPTCRL